MTAKTEYATVSFAEWQRDIIDAIEHQFYGILRSRITKFAGKHDGLTESDIRLKLPYRMDNGKINYFDWKMLWLTFQYMKNHEEFEEEHRGRGKLIIYRVKKPSP